MEINTKKTKKLSIDGEEFEIKRPTAEQEADFAESADKLHKEKKLKEACKYMQSYLVSLGVGEKACKRLNFTELGSVTEYIHAKKKA